MNARTEPLPLDWDEWRPLWTAWIAAQLDAGTMRRSSYRFPPPSPMADDVLGVYSVPRGDGTATTVELSEVRFPDLSKDAIRDRRRGDVRLIGVAYSQGSGTSAGGVHRTFADLEDEIGIGAV